VSLEDFKILSYNAYLLQHPTPGADRRPERAAEIAKAGFMKGYDVVILNEMFDDAPSHQILDGLRDEYPYQTPTVGESTSDDWDRTVGDLSSSAAVIRGGVVIVSKWPITERIQYIYEQACGADDLANKGFACTTIEYGDKQVHVIGTHVQAADADFFGNVLSSFGSLTTCSGISFLGIGSDPPDGYEAGWSERQSQFDELRQFLVNQNVPKEDLVLIGGDLNVPAHTPEYQWMLDKLGAVEPTGFQGHGSTYDPANNALIDDKNQPSVRLDYILISGDHYVPATWYNEVTQQSTSDHYPVAASMKATLPKATRNYNYKLSIKTGSKKGGFPFYEEQAGTDSNVKARLQGDDGSWSPWYVLDNDGNDFVANATDRYYLTTEIPSVRAIEFEKDSAGGGPDWYVESVSLKRVDGKSVSVTAKQWISKGNVTLVF
jgi:endonuclease/exonuclease/phosphatase family metal-dependent hydrolase